MLYDRSYFIHGIRRDFNDLLEEKTVGVYWI